MTTYTAVYSNSSGRFYNAVIFLSSITLSIRFTNENGETVDVYWLAEDISSFEAEVEGAVLKYRNKGGEVDRLMIRDPELIKAIRKHFSHHRFVGGWKHHVLGNTRTKIASFISLFIVLILAGYFMLVPWLGERVANSMSKEWEIGMGEKIKQSLMAEYKVDSMRTKLINRFFRELHYDLSYPISIAVVESKEINAFAVPGGHIVVFHSILERMERPEELAALLSHEVSHIQLRHSLRNMFRSLARKMFLALVIGNESGIAGFLVDNADNLKGLQYSRSLETEADNHGIALMKSARIDPRGMLGLMAMLRDETGGREPSAFLSTHPVFDSRIENIRQQIEREDIKLQPNQSLKSIFLELKHPRTTDW